LASLSLFLDGRTLPQRGVAHVSIIDIEVKSNKTIETFTIKSACDPLPMEVQMNGFYVLLSKINKIMDWIMLENPK